MSSSDWPQLRWKLTTLLGVLFWIGCLVAIAIAARSRAAEASRVTEIATHLFRRSESFPIQLPNGPLRHGDAVFAVDASGQWSQVGHATSSAESDPQPTAVIQWYGPQPASHYEFIYCRNRGTLAEAVEILLPSDRRTAILNRIAAAQRLHGPELTEAFKPVIEQTLRESVPVIEQALVQAVRAHQAEIDAIGKRFEAELINDRVVPLVRSELLPIVRAHGEPVATEIGQEIWDRASLFRFGWRIMYDKSPLPQRDLSQREWERFMEQEAIPVFESHVDAIVTAVKDILRDVVKNEAVRKEVTLVLQEVASDAQLQALAGSIVRDAIVENQALRQVWSRNWSTDRAQAAMQLANERLEPLVREIGDEIFGTPETGISPEFARVLRNQILNKDRRWIEAAVLPAPRDKDQPAVAKTDGQSHVYPLLFFAQET
ncbi:hypothetical protein Poly24_18280 [Rosistilla carotiformis]|uniref:Uncharacterized protein n=1 Tax=Rosistilla carotiformis TaxID=2528017 RepID=A0A518JRE6_9BACT|nr:hypothetical protein [Rosistilla carotiformis]QDV68120.1 hypothetical protein Poly24_18280 [Rosistilla carotiformis]